MFLVMMVAFIVVASARLEMLAENRNLLIIVDLLLALVTGMVLYDLSARRTDGPFTCVDLLSLTLMLAALVIDVMALGGIVARLSKFGFSPNRGGTGREHLAAGKRRFGEPCALRRAGQQRDILAYARLMPWYLRMAWVVLRCRRYIASSRCGMRLVDGAR